MFMLPPVIHTDTELEQTNLKKFKCQGYCLGGEC